MTKVLKKFPQFLQCVGRRVTAERNNPNYKFLQRFSDAIRLRDHIHANSLQTTIDQNLMKGHADLTD